MISVVDYSAVHEAAEEVARLVADAISRNGGPPDIAIAAGRVDGEVKLRVYLGGVAVAAFDPPEEDLPTVVETFARSFAKSVTEKVRRS